MANNADSDKYQEVADLCESFGYEAGELQAKWRDNPPEYNSTVEWWNELYAALMDALVTEGGMSVWNGVGLSSCAQIVEAYAKQTVSDPSTMVVAGKPDIDTTIAPRFEYEVIIEAQRDRFNRKLNQMVSDGWQVDGELCATDKTIVQRMVRRFIRVNNL